MEATATDAALKLPDLPAGVRFVGHLMRLADPVMPSVTTRMAARMFRSVRALPRPAREEAWLEGSTLTSFAAQSPLGGEVVVPAHVWGTGEPVLLVHGWEGRGSQMGAFAQPLVEAGYQAVAFDSPGHAVGKAGQSSLPEFAAALTAAQGEFGPCAGVVAHSLGCAAAAWVQGESSFAKRLVFISAPGDLDAYFHAMMAHIGLPGSLAERVITHLEAKLGSSWRVASRKTIEVGGEEPLLIVHDRGDEEAPVANVERIAALWPRAETLLTAELGHRRILRDEAVISRVVDFLAGEASNSTV